MPKDNYTPLRDTVEKAFREVNKNEPAVVAKTRRKKGCCAAEKQKAAIALSKARKNASPRQKAREASLREEEMVT